MDRNLWWGVRKAVGSVALRKESVDRNSLWCILCLYEGGSLSARRAWIEIASSLDDILAGVVALRKESVDRNLLSRPAVGSLISRSPQGERG